MVLYSFDNSQTWSYHLNAPELKSFIDVNNMFIYSVDGWNNLMRSTDLGQTWNQVLHFSSGNSYNINLYFEEKRGFVYGENGVIYKNQNAQAVGIDELEQKKRIKIYPNPTMEVLRIELSPGVQLEQIELFDSSGKKLKTFNKNERTLDISGLNSGNYLLKLRSKEGLFTEKVLIR